MSGSSKERETGAPGAGATRATAHERCALPRPQVTARMRPFWEAARQGRLVVQACSSCGARHFPAAETCAGCLRADALGWIEASGRGAVFSYVVFHQVYDPAFAADVPYAVIDVKLEEGPRMVSGIVGCRPQEVRIGMRVEVTFEARGDVHLPMFRPAKREENG